MIDYNNKETLKALTGLGNYPTSVNCDERQFKEFNRVLGCLFENDNTIIKLLLDSNEQVNFLDLSYSPDLDNRVQLFLSRLMREYPSLQGCNTPEQAFQFIRDRNMQYGAEINDYRQRLFNILDDAYSSQQSNNKTT